MKKRFFRLEKEKVQKVEKLRFFQMGLSMVLVQNGQFFSCSFLGNIGQENVFYDILEEF